MMRATLVGLGVIAVLTVAGFLVERHHVARERRQTVVVGLANAQAALVEEAALLMLRLTEYGFDRVTWHLEGRLHDVLDGLDRNQADLLHGDVGRGVPPPPPRVHRLLVHAPGEVAQRTRRFIDDVEAVLPELLLNASDAPGEVDRLIANARAQLVPGLERVAAAYQAHTHAQLRRLERLQEAFLVAVLATILIEVVFVFRPLARSLGADLDALRKAHDSLHRQLRRDELTGIANRRALMEALAEAPTPTPARAVLQIDLDRFKTVNDLLGHACGDAVLRAVARALRRVARSHDRAYRLGGDEFVVILDGEVSVEAAGRRAEAVIAAIIADVPQPALAAGLSASVGVAVCPTNDPEPARLLANADIALFEAKALGRHRYCVFRPAMREPLETRRSVEYAFRHALTNDALVLHFQPQVDLASGRVIGLEGLARWRRPDGDIWGADRFIPFIEDSPLIVDAAKVLIDRAVAMALELRRLGLDAGPIGINVADLQLRDPSFPDALLDRLDAAGLPPTALAVEVVERAFVGRGQQEVAAQLERLARAGVRIELDDFGTGHAALSHLKAFPVHRIKLDKSFVAGIGRDDGDETIVRATVEISASFGLGVVAEGVETEAQRRFLLEHGCREGQGYLFAAALPPSALVRWLQHRSPAAPPAATTPAGGVERPSARRS
ncbi:MAG: EAL domain-containing protein [Deinococcus-Thermus bacterium]|nr:EAL domain-containing protein [Deinococcota bacterium]